MVQRSDYSVLIVDDDAGIREILTTRLSMAGYACSAVASGEDALLAFSPEPPDVMILDISMPGMDGYEVCARIRETVDKPVSVIFLTGMTHAGTNSCLEQLVHHAGGDYFLAKPYDPKLLIELIDRITSGAVESSAGEV